MNIEVRFAVVFQKDGLDLEAVLEDLKTYGEVTGTQDDELIADDGERTPVMLVFLTASFGKFNLFKLKYNCVSAEDSQYVLFPMESIDAKREVMALRAGA